MNPKNWLNFPRPKEGAADGDFEERVDRTSVLTKLCPDIISVKEGRPLRYFESHSRSVIPTRFIVWGEWEGGEWDGGGGGERNNLRRSIRHSFLSQFFAVGNLPASTV